MAKAEVEGFLSIALGKETLTLRGTLKSLPKGLPSPPKIPPVNVGFSRPFDQSINLGSLPDIVGELASALDLVGTDLNATKIKEDMGDIPVVGELIDKAQIRITDLAINTTGDPWIFTFGFGLDLTNSTSTQFKTLKLNGLGVKFTVTKPKA